MPCVTASAASLASIATVRITDESRDVVEARHGDARRLQRADRRGERGVAQASARGDAQARVHVA